MIQPRTHLTVADNSGAKVAYCIKVLGGTGRRHAGVGDVIIVAIRSAVPRGKVQKGQVYSAVVVRTKSPVIRKDNSTFYCDDNAVVLLDKKGEPIGTRVFGAVAKELREKKFLRIISLAGEVA